MLVVEEPVIKSFDAVHDCQTVNQSGENGALLLTYPKENASGSLTFEFEVYADKRIILAEDLMKNKDQPNFPFVATRLIPYDKVEGKKHWTIQARNTNERTQHWTMTVDKELVEMKKNYALKFSVVDSTNREVGLERKINGMNYYILILRFYYRTNKLVKWTKEYPIDKFEWRLFTFFPIFLGLMLINFVSQNSNSKLWEHFKSYPTIGVDTYYSYLISFLIGFLTCYLMVYLADYFNTNGEGTFSLLPRRQQKDARQIHDKSD